MYISTCHTQMCCTKFEYSKVSLEVVNKPFDGFIYEILPVLDLTQSVHAKISIGMHRGVKFKISRIPLIGLETRLG
jgi:hypothetical protein